MKQRLVIKEKIKAIGFLTLDDKNAGTALFCGGENQETIVAELHRPHVIFITSNGIFLSGMKPSGADSAGRQKYVYEEWYCSYVKNGE